MFIEDLKDKNILILGITTTSIAISNFLKKENINISMWDISEKIKNKFKEFYNIIDNIDNISFDDYDFFIVPKDVLLTNEDFNTFLNRLTTVEEKVFIDIEFLYNLFPNNKYIGIIGGGYNYITNSLLNDILNTSNINSFNCASFEERIDINNIPKNINIEKDSVFSISLRQPKMNYLKQMNFDIVAILNTNDHKIEDIKKKIILRQSKESIVILNIDNPSVCDIYDELINDETVSYKIIPLSTNKMLDNGLSYINETIYDYHNNKNDSYDINTKLLTEVNKMSILCAFTIAKELDIDIKIIQDAITRFNGISNYLEVITQEENIRFINNIEANNKNLLLAPYKTYSNLYSIFMVNGKQSKSEFLRDYTLDSNKAFIVDLHNLVNIDNKKNVNKFNTLKEAFDAVIKETKKEEKENEITILLTPIINDDMNSIYYYSYGSEYKDLINDFKKNNN